MSTWKKTGDRIDARLASKKRTEIRKIFGASNAVPVLPGYVLGPVIVGESGGFFTRSGSRIAHPSAYAKKGFSSMSYRRSTVRIIVPE